MLLKIILLTFVISYVISFLYFCCLLISMFFFLFSQRGNRWAHFRGRGNRWAHFRGREPAGALPRAGKPLGALPRAGAGGRASEGGSRRAHYCHQSSRVRHSACATQFIALQKGTVTCSLCPRYRYCQGLTSSKQSEAHRSRRSAEGW